MTDDSTLRDLGEMGAIGLIKDLLKQHQSATPSGVRVDVDSGDDAAVFRVIDEGEVSSRRDRIGADASKVAMSIDVFTEGVHFRRDWGSATDVGRRAIAASAADVIAMGAVPALCLVSFMAPGETSMRWLRGLTLGIAEECNHLGMRVVGGDVSNASKISLCVTAVGVIPGDVPTLTRSGAQSGDVLAIFGSPGLAAAGMHILQRTSDEDGMAAPADREGDEEPAAKVSSAEAPAAKVSSAEVNTQASHSLVSAYRHPKIDARVGSLAARAGATAMIDVSDGLIADLSHVAQASEVSIDIDSAALPLAPDLYQAFDSDSLSAQTERQIITWALTGGDDHVFAATFPADASLPDGFAVIGRVEPKRHDSADLVTVDGRPFAAVPGYRHFS